MTARRRSGIARHVISGAVAGAVGTAAMDLLLYARQRRAGGKEPLLDWEFAAGVTGWDDASAPGQVGEKLERALTRQAPPDRWARTTTNVTHWATGIGWGVQYGILGDRVPGPPGVRALSLGPAAWLSSYVVLPLAGVYQPIWKYDVRTLADDLSAHVVFGVVTSAVFAALTRGGTVTTTTPGAGTVAQPDLAGQTVVVIGGSSGMGLETARLARARGAEVILTGRDPDRLRDAADQVGAESTSAFDVTDLDQLEQFFGDLPGPVDHIMLTGSGPYYSSLADMDFTTARRDIDNHLVVALAVARYGAARMRPPGTLLFIGGTGGRQAGVGLTLLSAMTAAQPALVANLAVELAPIRVNLIACGFVDTPLSATLLGDELEDRRAELRRTLPIGRVVGPADVAALAVHLMTNTALTGATYDIDGGQQLLSNRGGTR